MNWKGFKQDGSSVALDLGTPGIWAAIGAELRTRSLILDGTLQHTRITHISGVGFCVI